MRTHARLWAWLMAALLTGSVIGLSPARAASDCRAGRTLAGGCADPAAVDDLRTTAILLAQEKLSQTQPPVLPGADADYPVIRDPGGIAKIDRYQSSTGRRAVR